MAIEIPGTSEITRRLRGLRRAVSRDSASRFLISDADQSAFAESFRLLALDVRKRLNDHPSRTLAIVSAYEGDGRSTVAANLAIALGRHSRVLLAEHHPDLIGDRGWLLDSLAQKSSMNHNGLPEKLQERVGETGRGQLWVMWPNDPVLDRTGEIGPTIREAANAGMYTIIDTPAALGSSDAFRLAEQAGKALYVIRRKPQDMKEQARIRETLGRLDVDIIGLVVNEF